MRTIKLSAIIGKSIEGTTAILFRPFSLKKWLRLLFIAFLAGALAWGSGNGGGGGSRKNTAAPQKDETSKNVAQNDAISKAEKSSAHPQQQPAVPAKEKTPSSKFPIVLIAILIGLAGILIISMVFLITWLGSRFRFIWFNAIVSNTTAIREPYSRHRYEANSLFKFLIILLIGFLFFAATIGAGVWYAMFSHDVFKPGFIWSVPAALKIFLLPAILLILVVIGLVVLSYIVDHFIVPIMALEGLRITKALKKFGAIFRSYGKDIFLFTIVFFLLSIAGGAISMVLALLLLIVIALTALIVFGIPFFIIWFLLKAKLVFIIYAIVAGIPFAAIVAILFFALSLPFAVFFRLFSIDYLLSLNCGYSQEILDTYAAKRAERISGKAPIILSIVSLFFIVFIFFGGLFAAIAIPNFIKAREAARQKQAEKQATGTIETTGYNTYYQYLRTKIFNLTGKKYNHEYGEGEVVVDFVINQNGELVNAEIIKEKSCNNVILHDITLNSIKEASPFKPLPTNWISKQARFSLTVAFKKKL